MAFRDSKNPLPDPKNGLPKPNFVPVFDFAALKSQSRSPSMGLQIRGRSHCRVRDRGAIKGAGAAGKNLKHQ